MALLDSSPPSRMHAWRRRVLLACLALSLLPAVPLSAQADASREYQVKAVFLFNFAQFVEWPAQAFDRPDAPLVVGILGPDPFGSALDDVVRGENVGGHPLVIERYTRVDDVNACQILFISASEGSRLEQIVARLQDRAVLTVSDAESSAQRGVMIRFITDKGRIRLRVNLESSRQAGLQISSKLLRHAEIVGKKDGP